MKQNHINIVPKPSNRSASSQERLVCIPSNFKSAFRQIGLLMFVFFTCSVIVKAQEDQDIDLLVNGQIVKGLVQNGDTIMLSTLQEASIRMPQHFASKEERSYYNVTRRRAVKVYPYAVEAIKIFRKIEDFSKDSKKRQRKKYIKGLQKELKEDFEKPLKNLSKSQGKILIEMVERELDTSMFKLIRELKGGFKANSWTFAGKFYGYKLKKKYNPEDDPILEMVLSTFDISHDSE